MTVVEEDDLKYHVELRKHDLSRGKDDLASLIRPEAKALKTKLVEIRKKVGVKMTDLRVKWVSLHLKHF